jgi:hypothetical protein
MRIRLTVFVAGVLVVLVAWAADWSDAADVTKAGSVDPASLGRMLGTLGLKPTAAGTRFDFEFQTREGDQEWGFAMSAVISQDSGTIWLMAWLEEMPKQASKVPAAALLRMLAENDRLGNGKFFAYDRQNRRFLMQRVIPNEGITPAVLRDVIDDMAKGVIGSHVTWSVAQWAQEPALRQSALPPAPAAERRR